MEAMERAVPAKLEATKVVTGLPQPLRTREHTLPPARDHE